MIRLEGRLSHSLPGTIPVCVNSTDPNAEILVRHGRSEAPGLLDLRPPAGRHEAIGTRDVPSAHRPDETPGGAYSPPGEAGGWRTRPRRVSRQVAIWPVRRGYSIRFPVNSSTTDLAPSPTSGPIAVSLATPCRCSGRRGLTESVESHRLDADRSQGRKASENRGPHRLPGSGHPGQDRHPEPFLPSVLPARRRSRAGGDRQSGSSSNSSGLVRYRQTSFARRLTNASGSLRATCSRKSWAAKCQ